MPSHPTSTLKLCLLAIGVLTASPTAAQDAATPSPWGADDEIGRLNMMTEETRRAALSEVAGGQVYDLAVDYFVGMPTCCSDTFGDPSYQIYMTHQPARGGAEEVVSHSGDAFAMATHTGTHIDALSHFGLRGEIWNGVHADEALTERGWTRSGAETIPPILARGVLIDVAAAKDMAHLPPSYRITPDDLRTALDRQGTDIRPGDVVLVRTGLMGEWPDGSKFNLFKQPGLSLDAAKWLVEEKQAMMLGADNLGLESFPSPDPQNFAPVHTYLLAEQGTSFMELLWLEDLAADGVHQFLFVAAPIKLRGATGAPIRPIALPIGRSE